MDFSDRTYRDLGRLCEIEPLSVETSASCYPRRIDGVLRIEGILLHPWARAVGPRFLRLRGRSLEAAPAHRHCNQVLSYHSTRAAHRPARQRPETSLARTASQQLRGSFTPFELSIGKTPEGK